MVIRKTIGFIGSGLCISQIFAASGAIARPAAVFQPHLYQIRQELPPNYEMRLPADLVLTAGPGLNPSELIVKLIPSSNPPRMTIGLFTCEQSPYPCLVGGFSVQSSRSASAQQELSRHQSQGNPITLSQGVRGFLREGPSLQPASEFSSLMWQQNQMIYTISFLAAERENILSMGRSMANQPPLRSVQPIRTTVR